MLALVSTSAGCSGIGGSCNTDSLPPEDPCFMRACCDTVQVVPLPDGGVVAVPDGVDAGVPTQSRLCGACNG